MTFLPLPVITDEIAKTIILWFSPVVAFILFFLQPTTYGKLDGTQAKRFRSSSSGRHWLGPLLPSKWSWMVFESPSWIWVIIVVSHKGWFEDNIGAVSSRIPFPLSNKVLLGWFFLHYIHRSFLYPLQKSNRSKMPLGISLFALSYNLLNGYIQAYDLVYQQTFPPHFERSWQFQLGMILTWIGFAIGYHSDQALLGFKREMEYPPKSTVMGYQIPRGGLFAFVSCPHYFGELIEWTGFCIANNYSLASISFLVWTMANLVPRAYATHLWYHDTFRNEYPALQRKVVIPFIF